jgi:hypothetical protein
MSARPTTKPSLPTIATAAWLLLVCGVASVSAQPTTLSPTDIDDAIRLGWYYEPEPYLLRGPGRPWLETDERRVTVGAVYTPFIRVALASKAARMTGRTFQRSDVPSQLLEPVVYVVFRWYFQSCCPQELPTFDAKRASNPKILPAEPDPTAFNARRTWDHKILLPGEPAIRNGGDRVTAHPLWVSRDLSILGTDPPFVDAVLIAAYPLSVLTSGNDFVIYRGPTPKVQPPGAPGLWQAPAPGQLVDTEVARWR